MPSIPGHKTGSSPAIICRNSAKRSCVQRKIETRTTGCIDAAFPIFSTPLVQWKLGATDCVACRPHSPESIHALAEVLRRYIDAAGIAEDRKGFLFRTSPGHSAMVLTEQPMVQADAWRMIRRRAVAAGIFARIGNHTFRATGITAYLSNGGAHEHAQSMAAHDEALRSDEGTAHPG